MLVKDVLDSLAALGDRAAVWDPYGLQLGDPQAAVEKLGICHEVTPEVVEKARSVDLLVTYHPLLFKPTTRIVAGRGPEARAFDLIRSGTSLAVVHTAWDAAPGGSADALAAMVGVTDLEPFGAIEQQAQWKLVTTVPPQHVDEVARALTKAGAGRIGNYSACSFRSEGIGTFIPGPGSAPAVGEPGELNRVEETRLEMLITSREPAVAALLASHPYEEPSFDIYQSTSSASLVGRVGAIGGRLSELADQLRNDVGESIRVAGEDRPLRRAAVLPGSGGSFIGEARSRGADVLVTGEVSHHQMRQALDEGMAVIDLGHAPSERPGVAALTEAVGKFGIPLVAVDVDPTPWKR